MYLTISNLNFSYGKNEIIKDFNLEIEQGKIVAILGQSGSGKSTLLRLLAGLEVPSSGEIEVDGDVIVSQSHYTEVHKRDIGLVFQDYALFPHMTVEKNVKYGLKKMSKVKKEEILDQVLKLVDLSDYKRRYPHELSGGQMQRVALARALAPKPKILLLDEPFSNLDANLKGRIRTELKDILKKANMTSIFVTHDVEDAKALADEIVYI